MFHYDCITTLCALVPLKHPESITGISHTVFPPKTFGSIEIVTAGERQGGERGDDTQETSWAGITPSWLQLGPSLDIGHALLYTR